MLHVNINIFLFHKLKLSIFNEYMADYPPIPSPPMLPPSEANACHYIHYITYNTLRKHLRKRDIHNHVDGSNNIYRWFTICNKKYNYYSHFLFI